ncbi:MAG: hypothetical protein ACLP0J_20930 [Solirubrobacteraceae bacterium]
MLHLELRQRPHVAHAFNLLEQEVALRVLGPLVAGRPFDYAEREWDPRKTKLTVLEGPELRLAEIGMGRGWANAQRSGTDVTERLIARAREQHTRPPELDRLKQRIVGRIDAGPLPLQRVVSLTAELLPGRRASERLSLAEIAVWELLHERVVVLLASGAPGSEPVAELDWQAHLLSWECWSAADAQATTSSIISARSASDANR